MLVHATNAGSFITLQDVISIVSTFGGGAVLTRNVNVAYVVRVGEGPVAKCYVKYMNSYPHVNGF